MKRIPQEFIQSLIAQIDLVSFLDSKITFKKKSNSSCIALCPFHQEKTPSFHVSPAKQVYHCFGCKVGGNVISFVMDFYRLSFVEAVEMLAEQYHLKIPYHETAAQTDYSEIYQTLKDAAVFFQEYLWQEPAAQAARNYLTSRGLTKRSVKNFALGFAPFEYAAKNFSLDAYVAAGLYLKKTTNSHLLFRKRLMFPIRDRQGRVIGFGGRALGDDLPKYINSPETAVFHKSHELYGLYEVLQQRGKLQKIMVVEGYLDVISCHQYGFPFAVAPLGTALTLDQIKKLLRVTTRIDFCFDGDQAGLSAAWRTLEILLPLLDSKYQFRFIILPQNADPDSILQQENGKQQLQQAIDNALSFSDFLLKHLLQQADFRSLDGRIQFCDAALEHIKKIIEPLYRETLLAEVAKISEIDITQLKAKLTSPIQNIIKQKTQAAVRSMQPRSLLKHIFTLLLHYPELRKQIKNNDILQKISLPKKLIPLLEFFQEHVDWSVAACLEHWRDTALYATLQKLAEFDETINEKNINAEFNAVVKKLLQQNREAQVQQLLNIAKSRELTPDEKKELQVLLVERD